VSRFFRCAAGVMTALFVLSAAVQWNDPDPAYWIAIYGVAALLAARAAQGQLPLVPNAAALAVFVALALRALPDLLGGREEAFTHWKMLAERDEVAREAGGLMLCALWSGVQTALALARRPDARRKLP
jgi:Transmembrane family 220, helix